MHKPPTIPQQLEHLSAEFVTAVLTPHFPNTIVTEVHTEPLAPNANFNAQLARLQITYDSPATEAPKRLIAKLPTTDTTLHENAAVFHPGQKENWFYEQGAIQSSVNVPICFYNNVDPNSGESILLLEDLSPAQSGSRLNGCSLAEAKAAMQAIANLHADWWDRDLASIPKLAQFTENGPQEQALVEQLYRDGWPRFLKRVQAEIPNDVRRLGDQLVGRVAEAESLLDSSPKTLIHGDFRLENVLFENKEEQICCWLVDWEDVLWWNGMFDVAWFIMSGLPTSANDREEILLRSYHDTITSRGISYSRDNCFNDYHLAMLSAFVQSILTISYLGSNDVKLATLLSKRLVAACDRLHLHEFWNASVPIT